MSVCVCFISMGVCTSVCGCICMWTCMGVEIRSPSCDFLNCSLSSFLRYDLSLNLELISFIGLSD